jgi:adenylosuccinate synthase
MGAIIIVGAQWGDEGKGLISAYLNARENAGMVVRAGTGANAEHGIFLHDLKTYLKVNQLPLGWMFNKKTLLSIGSGVAVDPVKFAAEVEKYGLKERVSLDYRCPIITPEHIKAEEESKGMASIGSTFSGTGYCRADFALRKAKQARDIAELESYCTDTGKNINTMCRNGDTVIIESSQGTFLSPAVTPDYPNATSDNVTAMAAADDVLLNWKHIQDVVLVVKALPTREGSGAMGNARELSIDEINKRGFVEPSSIGGVTRRKAELDLDMLKYAVMINGATQIALTFCDHYDPNITDKKNIDELTKPVADLIRTIEVATKVPVTILNTGKAYDNIIDLDSDMRVDWKAISSSLPKG